MPLFSRKPNSLDDLDEKTRDKWAREISEGLQTVIGFTNQDIGTVLMQTYDVDQDTAARIMQCVWDVLMGIDPPQFPGLLEQYKEIIDEILYGFQNRPAMAEIVGMTLRQWVVYLTLTDQLEDYARNVHELTDRMEKYKLPSEGQVLAPAVFLERAQEWGAILDHETSEYRRMHAMD